jgi:UDPglucose 6-dehydrogenase
LILENNPNAIIALWGLAYKENTHSIKNSAAILTISSLKQTQFKGYDPAALLRISDFSNLIVTSNPLDALIGANVLMILTPWPEFKKLSLQKIASTLKGNIIIDPYQLFDVDEGSNFGLNIVQLGKAAKKGI